MKRRTPVAANSPARQLNTRLGRFDPAIRRLVLGGGNQGRFVRLESAATLDRREIDDLLAATIAEGETPLPRSGRGHIVIKSVSPKPRLRRQ